MLAFGAFLVFLSLAASPAIGGVVTNVRPEVLDMLLQTKQYEAFAKLLNIEDVNLVIPKEEAKSENPMFHKELRFGDIMFPKANEETARQGIRFDKYPGSKWPNQRVPYYVANDYTQNQRDTINEAINNWNYWVKCVKLSPWRNGDDDYVYVFSGNGCYSYLGRIGGGQALSLQSNGCVWRGTVLHEFMHAVGFAHEHNRHDRDGSVDILWDNIPSERQDQYKKTDPNDYGLQSNYDYYSLMHYPYNAPGTNKPAFNIKANGVDTNRLGNGDDFTWTDLDKITELYNC